MIEKQLKNLGGNGASCEKQLSNCNLSTRPYPNRLSLFYAWRAYLKIWDTLFTHGYTFSSATSRPAPFTIGTSSFIQPRVQATPGVKTQDLLASPRQPTVVVVTYHRSRPQEFEESHTYTYLQWSIIRDSMAYALVHTGTHALGKLAVIQARRVRVVVYDEPEVWQGGRGCFTIALQLAKYYRGTCALHRAALALFHTGLSLQFQWEDRVAKILSA
eukprot:1153181-Pelagomonas_calceolata.AAC.4